MLIIYLKNTIFHTDNQQKWVHKILTSPASAELFPDQKRCEHVATPLHWSGFFSSLDAARAHCVRNGSWFSSPKQDICSSVPIIKVIAASWALLSEISSSYRENAWKQMSKKCVHEVLRIIQMQQLNGTKSLRFEFQSGLKLFISDILVCYIYLWLTCKCSFFSKKLSWRKRSNIFNKSLEYIFIFSF